MRKLLGLSAILMLFSFITSESTITEKERKFALDYYQQTKTHLQDAVKGLSDAQMNWKPGDSVWSVAQCIEHIALSEKNIFDGAQASLKEAANPDKRKELKFTSEDQVIKLITDRSFKVKTTDALTPGGQFGSPQQTLETFLERRNSNMDYLKNTQDDLHNHFVTLPFGVVDTYQFLIFLSGHTERHILQIEEVKANPGFPKS